jgi:hypothetical protein
VSFELVSYALVRRVVRRVKEDFSPQIRLDIKFFQLLYVDKVKSSLVVEVIVSARVVSYDLLAIPQLLYFLLLLLFFIVDLKLVHRVVF